MTKEKAAEIAALSFGMSAPMLAPHSMDLGLCGLDQCIEGLAGAHDLLQQIGRRQVIAANVGGLALDRFEFFNDLLLVLSQAFGQRCKLGLQFFVLSLCGQFLCPVHG